MARCLVPYSAKHQAFLLPVVVDNPPFVKAKLGSQGRPIPRPFNTMALIDTGASSCNASPKLVDALDLQATSNKLFKVNTGNGEMNSARYACAFKGQVDEDFGTVCIPIFRYRLDNPIFDLVIGMEFLEDFHISYHPKEKVMCLEKPPPELPPK